MSSGWGFLILCNRIFSAAAGLTLKSLPGASPASWRGSGPARKKAAALRRQLRPVADHAGFDALDIRNFGAAEPEGVGSAGLLLLESIGVTFARGHSSGEQQCEPEPRMRYDRHRISLEAPSAKCAVNRGCFASVACRFPRGTLKIGMWSWLGNNNRLSGAQESQAAQPCCGSACARREYAAED